MNPANTTRSPPPQRSGFRFQPGPIITIADDQIGDLGDLLYQCREQIHDLIKTFILFLCGQSSQSHQDGFAAETMVFDQFLRLGADAIMPLIYGVGKNKTFFLS